MTGFLNSGDNYLTPMTLGLLEDNGFTVNYGSSYVVSSGTNFWWIPESNLIANNSITNERSRINGTKCKNCKVIL